MNVSAAAHPWCDDAAAAAAQHFIARYQRGQHLLCYECYDENRFPGRKRAAISVPR